jgi:AraC-like DNA-binding protein
MKSDVQARNGAAAAASELIPFLAPATWIKAAVRCGFSIEPLFRAAGIEADLRHHAVPMIRPATLLWLMRECTAHAQAPHHFPFVLGETFAFENLPALDTFITTSPTLRDSLRILDWLQTLMPLCTMTVEEQGDLAVLRVTLSQWLADTPGAEYFVELEFASINKFARILVGDEAQAERVCFRHGSPERLAQYEQLLRAPVHLNQPYNGVVFKRALLDAPLKGASPTLHKQAESVVTEYFSKNPGKTSLVDTLYKVFAENPQLLGQGIERTAARFQLHPRTLQRRLQDEGHRFAEVQARARFNLATDWLVHEQTDVETVSERLGFADRHSFTRAFKRWAGLTPSEFRRQGRVPRSGSEPS